MNYRSIELYKILATRNESLVVPKRVTMKRTAWKIYSQKLGNLAFCEVALSHSIHAMRFYQCLIPIAQKVRDAFS